jgi:hypothetical protein
MCKCTCNHSYWIKIKFILHMQLISYFSIFSIHYYEYLNLALIIHFLLNFNPKFEFGLNLLTWWSLLTIVVTNFFLVMCVSDNVYPSYFAKFKIFQIWNLIQIPEFKIWPLVKLHTLNLKKLSFWKSNFKLPLPRVLYVGMVHS